MKTAVSDMENTLDLINSKLDTPEEKYSEFGDREIKSFLIKQDRKKTQKTKQSKSQ
jgi:hypothetical protein